MQTVRFEIRSSEKYLFGFNHSNSVVKTELFSKKGSSTLILATYCSSMQTYFEISLILTIFNFYIEKHEPYGSPTKNCL